MMLLSVVSLFLLAVLAPGLHRVLRGWTGPALAAVPAAWTVYFAMQFSAITGGAAQETAWQWVPGLGLELAFRLDGLSLLFALLICGIGTLIVLYAGCYLANHPQLGRFFASLIAFMASMLGLVLADDLIAMFIFWELTSITSYLLIGFDHEREAARKAALQALLVTGIGGLALLAGVLLLGSMAGTWRIGELAAQAEVIRGHELYFPMLVLILGGAFTKSAMFPFHFWLPNAMEAPAPVSAYLHSSTMVKAGVYLLARLSPSVGGTDEWMFALVGFGAFTMAFAAIVAARQVYFKRLLAYSTVSSLGAMIMLIGLGELKAAATYILAHAMFKGSLFMMAGIAEKKTGTKNVETLGALRTAMPLTTIAALLAALSMAGVPLFFGFQGKELLLKASLAAEVMKPFVIACSFIGGALGVYVAIMVSWRPFIAPRRNELEREPHDGSLLFMSGPLLLAVGGVLAGIVPQLAFATGIVGGTAAAMGGITGTPASLPDLELGTMLKPGLALAMSGAALVVGAALYITRTMWRPAVELGGLPDRVGPAAAYGVLLNGTLDFARLQTRVLQCGSLRVYFLIVLSATLALIGLAAYRGQSAIHWPELSVAGVAPIDWVFILVSMVSAVVATQLGSRLAVVAVLGGVGFAVAIVFLLYGAPDVAMTQFAVETLTVIIFVLVLYHLPRFSIFSGRIGKIRDAIIASIFGITMGAGVLLVSASNEFEPISTYFSENAASKAYGRNIVNVILVDFRAVDTLGEIVVLAISGIGVYTLLKLFIKPEARV